MKKLLNLFFIIILGGLLFPSCKEDTVCLECVITIAGIEEDKGRTCGELNTINELEKDYQEIVDRENSIVPATAILDCKKYKQP